MTLALTRVDYISVGVTARGTTKLLPSDSKQTQKFVVGDYDGIIHIYGNKTSKKNVFINFTKFRIQIIFENI